MEWVKGEETDLLGFNENFSTMRLKGKGIALTQPHKPHIAAAVELCITRLGRSVSLQARTLA